MRSVIVLVVAMFALAIIPPAAATEGPALLVVYRNTTGDAVLTWSATPGATMYLIYRGESLREMQLIAESREPFYMDSYIPDGPSVFYGVAGTDGVTHSDTSYAQMQSGGQCGVMYYGGFKAGIGVSGCLG